MTTVSTTPEGDTKRTVEETRTSPSGDTTRTVTTTTVTGTVGAFVPGKTITLKQADGTEVTYYLEPDSQIPQGLVAGRTVMVRLGRQGPARGAHRHVLGVAEAGRTEARARAPGPSRCPARLADPSRVANPTVSGAACPPVRDYGRRCLMPTARAWAVAGRHRDGRGRASRRDKSFVLRS